MGAPRARTGHCRALWRLSNRVDHCGEERFFEIALGKNLDRFCNEGRRQLVEPQPYDATVWPGGLAPVGL
jgi:hypothetical protein